MATAVYGYLGAGHVEIVWQPQPGDPPDTCIWWLWYQLLQSALRVPPPKVPRARRPRATSLRRRRRHRETYYGELGDIDWFGGA